MLFSKRMLLGLAAMAALALCWPVAGARAGAYEIEANSRAAMERFFHDVPSSRELANKAAGILVFPMVVKAGFGFGGEYGEGALFIGGRRPAITTTSQARSASSSARRRAPSSSCS